MAIGEFGGAPAVPAGGPLASTPIYWLYEMTHAALNPARAWADAVRLSLKNPINPLYHTTFGKSIAAAAELFERSTRRYGRPEWRISSTLVGGERVPVHITCVWERPFCRLLHFERAFEHRPASSAAAAAHRCAALRPLRDVAARYGRGVPAQSRRLHHRVVRCAHDTGVGRTLRSRRLYRLSDLDIARAGRRYARRSGVPAGSTGDGGRSAHGRR